jgi:hypothetical protein
MQELVLKCNQTGHDLLFQEEELIRGEVVWKVNW